MRTSKLVRGTEEARKWPCEGATDVQLLVAATMLLLTRDDWEVWSNGRDCMEHDAGCGATLREGKTPEEEGSAVLLSQSGRMNLGCVSRSGGLQ